MDKMTTINKNGYEKECSYNGLDICFRKDDRGFNVDISGCIFKINEFLYQLDEQYLHPMSNEFRRCRKEHRLSLLNYVSRSKLELTGERICYKDDWISYIDKVRGKNRKLKNDNLIITLTQRINEYERIEEMVENVHNALKNMRSEKESLESLLE